MGGRNQPAFAVPAGTGHVGPVSPGHGLDLAGLRVEHTRAPKPRVRDDEPDSDSAALIDRVSGQLSEQMSVLGSGMSDRSPLGVKRSSLTPSASFIRITSDPSLGSTATRRRAAACAARHLDWRRPHLTRTDKIDTLPVDRTRQCGHSIRTDRNDPSTMRPSVSDASAMERAEPLPTTKATRLAADQRQWTAGVFIRWYERREFVTGRLHHELTPAQRDGGE